MTVPTAGTGELLADLLAERSRLTDLLGPLPEPAWRARPASGHWTIAEHVTALALLDEAAALAVTAPTRFVTHSRSRMACPPRLGDIDARHRDSPGPELLSWLGAAQTKLVRAYRRLDPAHLLPWYGTDLDAGTALAARIAETWAHGRDVAAACGANWVPTNRLRHVAELGIRSLGASFEALGRPVPTVPVRIELSGPDDQAWTWGREQARDRVTGTAEDLCLVLTGRRTPAQVGLRVNGVVVAEWLEIARPYPGAPEAPGWRGADASVS
ncbi:MAG: maleylpyruvate isomerase family mycothiol-dependent enzyme [Pseudonocardia sp.]